MQENILKMVGLSAWEEKAYESLLKVGETTTGPLVKSSDIPQSKIYAVLEMLAKKGLVTIIKKNNIKHFQAVPTNRILALFREKEKDIQAALQSMSIKGQPATSVELYEGLKAIRIVHAALLMDVKKGENVYGYSKGDAYSEETNKFYHWWGERKRISGLKDHLLICNKVKKKFEASVKPEQLDYVRSKTRYTPLSLPTDTLIFRDTVILYHWQNPSQAIILNSRFISEQYKEFFMQLWRDN